VADGLGGQDNDDRLRRVCGKDTLQKDNVRILADRLHDDLRHACAVLKRAVRKEREKEKEKARRRRKGRGRGRRRRRRRRRIRRRRKRGRREDKEENRRRRARARARARPSPHAHHDGSSALSLLVGSQDLLRALEVDVRLQLISQPTSEDKKDTFCQPNGVLERDLDKNESEPHLASRRAFFWPLSWIEDDADAAPAACGSVVRVGVDSRSRKETGSVVAGAACAVGLLAACRTVSKSERKDEVRAMNHLLLLLLLLLELLLLLLKFLCD
jgi:hypothetical protein